MSPQQVREERLKLFAFYLNIMAAGIGIGAVVTAPISLITRVITPIDAERTAFLFAFIVICVVISPGLHLIAQGVLKRL